MDFSDLGGQPIPPDGIDFSDLGGRKINPAILPAALRVAVPMAARAAMVTGQVPPTAGVSAGRGVPVYNDPLVSPEARGVGQGAIQGVTLGYGMPFLRRVIPDSGQVPLPTKSEEMEGDILSMPVAGAEMGGAMRLAGKIPLIGKAVAMGVPMAMGYANNPSGNGVEPAISGKRALNAGLAGVMQAGGAMLGATPKLAKRAISNIFGPSEEAVNARIATPEAIKNAGTFGELASKVPATLEKLSDKISEADKNAWNTLSISKHPDEGAKPLDSVAQLIEETKTAIGKPVGPADRKALGLLEGIYKDIVDKFSEGGTNEYDVESVAKRLRDSANIEGEDIIARIQNAGGIKQTESYRVLGDLREIKPGMRARIYNTNQHGLSWDEMAQELGMSDTDLMKAVNKAQLYKKAAPNISDYMHEARGMVEKYKAENPAYISEGEIKDTIKRIDDNIDWDKPGSKTANTALKWLRTGLDQTLKDANPAYKAAMKPVEDHMNLLRDAEKVFVPKRVVGQGYAPSDTTISKLQNIYKGSPKDATKAILRRLAAVTGDDYLTASKNASLAEQFQGGRTAGSRNVNRFTATLGALGGAAGAVIDKGMGAAMGAGAGSLIGSNLGATIDKEGGAMAGKLIDYYTAHPEEFRALQQAINMTSKGMRTAGAVMPGPIMRAQDGYKVGDMITTPKGAVRVVGLDTDGHPLIEPMQ